MRRQVLALSYLFPNRAQPAYGVFVRNRLAALAEHCDVRVIAPVQWYPLMSTLRPELHCEAIPPADEIGGLRVRYPRFFTIPRYLKWIDAVSCAMSVNAVMRRLRAEEDFDPDILDVHWTYPDAPVAAHLARRLGKKFIVTVRGHEALYGDEFTLRRCMVRWALRRADHVVALSEDLRAEVEALGIRREKTSVILNGVDRGTFYPRGIAESRDRLKLPRDKQVILSIGRLTAGKGHQHLIAALPEVATKRDVELYIIGGVNPESDYSDTLKRLVRSMGLVNVNFIDRVDHESLPYWYSAADLFCLMTSREGCPNVVLESLACGTPVVVSDVGAASQFIASCRNGYLLSDASHASVARAIVAALGRNWDRNSIARDMGEWGWGRCATEVLGVYDAVLPPSQVSRGL